MRLRPPRIAPQRRATRPPGAQHLHNLNASREAGVSAPRARPLQALVRHPRGSFGSLLPAQANR